MALVVSPPKIILLAVELASKADVGRLSCLAARHGAVLRKDVLLRILLTYLPETLPSDDYVPFVQEIESGRYSKGDSVKVDYAAVENLEEGEAARRVRKLRLLPLISPEAPADASQDPTTLFLLRRAYQIDEEAGLLDELPGLLELFLDHSPRIRTLLVSAVLPLLRRNFEYYPAQPIPYTLASFQQLPDPVAAVHLLSQTDTQSDNPAAVGRDLRGLIGPWLYYGRQAAGSDIQLEGAASDGSGWRQVLEWLTLQASKSWRVAVGAVEQWDGPNDVDLGGYETVPPGSRETAHLEGSYARAALACAYIIPEASVEALSGAHSIVARVAKLLDLDPMPSLQAAASMLPPIPRRDVSDMLAAKNATYLRNDLLEDANTLTAPSRSATQFLHGLVLSAFFLARAGSPCTVRRAGELVLLQDEREQKTEALRLIHTIGANGPKSDDKYWIKARNEILWLRDWGSEEESSSGEHQLKGVFGQIEKDFLETEFLKALLTNTRYALARSLYEDAPEKPLDKKTLRDTIFGAALDAFDNASNPNRTRGGLKKCDDIISAFPQTVERSLAATQRIEALLKAAHALSGYRLVLKQGEPFTPVVLRVHPDPISIIGKILEQNPKSYSGIQGLIDLGLNMVEAGLTTRDERAHSTLTAEPQPQELTLAERRVTAMCIDAALAEDDFETAYSLVVQRLSAISEPAQPSSLSSAIDDYSWKAALQAGKYRRTAHTLRPTHLGTSSANPDIRHLEQRIECLATALRIAPASTLQDIIGAFRRCEEELDVAIKAEAEMEDAWDSAADELGPMPGGFGGATAGRQSASASAAAAHPRGSASSLLSSSTSSSSRRRAAAAAAAEEAPMSLFDLSRASVRSAQRNLTALSGLRNSGLGLVRAAGTGIGARDSASARQRGSRSPADSRPQSGPGSGEEGGGSEDDGQAASRRPRKRDQLREAAVGTLVSGVGWLINAPAERQDKE